MEEHLWSLLSDAVDFPVAWGTMGHGASLPRASLHRVGGVREMTLDGLGLISGRVQVDCYGGSFAEALEASREVRVALEGYRGGPIQGIFLDSIGDRLEGDATLLHRVRLTFSITYSE